MTSHPEPATEPVVEDSDSDSEKTFTDSNHDSFLFGNDSVSLSLESSVDTCTEDTEDGDISGLIAPSDYDCELYLHPLDFLLS